VDIAVSTGSQKIETFFDFADQKQTQHVHYGHFRFSEDTNDFYAVDKDYRKLYNKKSIEVRKLRKRVALLEKKCESSIESMRQKNFERFRKIYDQEETIAKLQAEILRLKQNTI
jgi:flagellar motility protein MotE (MotC chaperone)